jgi:hypothetical protein
VQSGVNPPGYGGDWRVPWFVRDSHWAAAAFGAVNGGVTRGDSLVARLRGEMAEQGLVPISVEEEHLATAKGLADRIEKLAAMVGAGRRELETQRWPDRPVSGVQPIPKF